MIEEKDYFIGRRDWEVRISTSLQSYFLLAEHLSPFSRWMKNIAYCTLQKYRGFEFNIMTYVRVVQRALTQAGGIK